MTPVSSNDKLMVGSPTSVIFSPPKKELPPLHSGEEEHDDSWICPASAKSKRTTNPIRAIVDPIVSSSNKECDDGKQQISLALGDPTSSKTLKPCPIALTAVKKALESETHAAGYVNACGTVEARKAIAKHHDVAPDNVIVASGCSGALELALTALLDPGTVLLVPRPGFPLYQVIAESHGATVAHYNLLPNRGWECDLNHLEELMQQYSPGTVRGIVVNNPSNPTGAVYCKQHLQEIVHWARVNRVPIVADEIYGDLVFGETEFHPLAKVAAKQVPVITASGIGKQYLLPGWRVGWVAFHDSQTGALREVEAGAKRLAQLILGASHLAQTAVPALLTPESSEDAHSIIQWKEELRQTLKQQAATLCEGLSRCQGLDVIEPQGCMYSMVQIDLSKFDSSVCDDVSFTKLLLEEENVFVLPGRAFGVEDVAVFRVVFCADEATLNEASARVAAFCERHAAWLYEREEN